MKPPTPPPPTCQKEVFVKEFSRRPLPACEPGGCPGIVAAFCVHDWQLLAFTLTNRLPDDGRYDEQKVRLEAVLLAAIDRAMKTAA